MDFDTWVLRTRTQGREDRLRPQGRQGFPQGHGNHRPSRRYLDRCPRWVYLRNCRTEKEGWRNCSTAKRGDQERGEQDRASQGKENSHWVSFRRSQAGPRGVALEGRTAPTDAGETGRYRPQRRPFGRLLDQGEKVRAALRRWTQAGDSHPETKVRHWPRYQAL